MNKHKQINKQINININIFINTPAIQTEYKPKTCESCRPSDKISITRRSANDIFIIIDCEVTRTLTWTPRDVSPILLHKNRHGATAIRLCLGNCLVNFTGWSLLAAEVRGMYSAFTRRRLCKARVFVQSIFDIVEQWRSATKNWIGDHRSSLSAYVLLVPVASLTTLCHHIFCNWFYFMLVTKLINK